MPVKNLCIKIARCTQFGVFPCDKIASVQSNCILKQVPEPWSGHLDKAKIMFIGSNPSIDCDEYFPNVGWSDNDIFDFFENRFIYGKKLKTTGKAVSVPYWTYLINYTNWINECLKKYGKSPITRDLVKQTKEPFYKDLNDCVVSTELVHCKSKNAFGFDASRCTCSGLWMANILNLFNGKLIVVLGSKAKDAINKCSNLNAIILGKKLPVIFLPHPSRRMSDTDRKKEIEKELKNFGLIP